MRNITLKLAVLGALGFASTQASAAFVSLPAAPTGSAYINCFNDGRVIPPSSGPQVTALQARANFGTLAPAGSSGTCEITGLANDVASPKTGYTIVTSASRNIPSVTGGSTVIGTLTERIWRKPAATAPTTPTDVCIFGAKVTFTNTDHDSGTAGTQYFEANDFARGGFGSGAVNVGYFVQAAGASPVYRAGRSFTSVQHRALKYGGTVLERQQNGTGYLDLPTIGGATTLAINGVNAGIGPTTTAAVGTAADQDAQVNSNWVDFTFDVGFLDDDGETNAVSAMTYVEAACNSDTAAVINGAGGWVKTGALRIRQTAQENTTFKEIAIDGYAPPGATVP